MSLLRTIGATFVCALASAVGANALTLNISVTGDVAYVDYGGFGVPPANAPISVGDTFTVTYSLNTNQIGQATTPNVFPGAYNLDSVLAYAGSAAQISFSSGFTATSSPVTIKPHAFSLLPGMPQPDDYFMALTTESATAATGLGDVNLFSSSSYFSNTSPYSTSPTGLFALTNDTPRFSDLDFVFTPTALGLAASGCPVIFGISRCDVYTSNVQATVSVAPVPIPAPFAMLGLSVAGLLTLRRRRTTQAI